MVQRAISLAHREPAAPGVPATVDEVGNDLIDVQAGGGALTLRSSTGQIDLGGKIVTAEALHTAKASAEFACDHGGSSFRG